VTCVRAGNSGAVRTVGRVEAFTDPKELPMNDRTVSRLQELEMTYTVAVNEAVAEDRDDLISDLVAEYPNAIAEVLAQDAA
jgi:hypothetical protein